MLGVALLPLLGGCASSRPSDPVPVSSLQPRPIIKPEGVIIDRTPKMGPPPPGHPRIVGEPVPDWRWGMNERQAYPLNWTFMGPSEISNEYWSGRSKASGRVITIAPHPTNPTICYIGAASGGLWKTTNGGASWSPKTDHLSILNSGAITIHPDNHDIIFYGTGEYQTSSNGDGLFRSLDAGETWEKIATTAQVGTQITAIAINPQNPQQMHLTSNTGAYVSFDGGLTWGIRLTGACPTLALDPIDPSRVYVGRAGQGVYRSTNGGVSYTKLAGGLPTTNLARVMVDLCDAEPINLYAAIVGTNGSVNGLFRSTNGGDTWVKKTNTPNFCSPQCWYDAYVAADPYDPDTVYLGGVDPRYAVAGVLRSTNGGDTWVELSQVGPGTLHPDHHTMAFGPGGIIWEGNDGGVWKSTDNAASWINCNNGLATAQLYTVAIHPALPDKILGGTQDNGTPERVGPGTAWPQLQAGDGGFSAYDHSHATRRYTTYVYLTIYRWTTSGSREITGPWGSDPTNWISPMVIDPVNASRILAGTNRVWQTTNATATNPSWTAISTTANGGGGVINSIAIAPSSTGVIYTGSNNGRVYVTINNGSSWDNRSSGLPTSGVSDIIVSPTDPGTAYASFYTSSGGRVFKTTNYGTSWSPVGANLPGGVVPRALEIDYDYTPHGLYVGAGAGFYHSLDGGATWVKNNNSFPNANVGDMVIDRTRRRLVVGTYGRGAWMTNLPNPCPSDYNNDGVMDVLDFLDFIDDFSACDQQAAPCGTAGNADFNADGTIDILDFLDFVDAFSQGC
jgi:hypothetical protein